MKAKRKICVVCKRPLDARTAKGSLRRAMRLERKGQAVLSLKRRS